ncbi:hypothetical protein EW145_g7902 [Phellinidium pouzarii]|uniref:Uncharacterized protein n=1 Tax=Phellinidium pouzarii TaxID=167371 RepID=A0A4S4KDI0_9AGAM|nr:hypothetical protein EW145_g7902 [Phellinidium pouzarii]
MPLPVHLPHVIYATALTSLALHLLATRKASVSARRQAAARIGLLESLAAHLRTGEHVSQEELGRVRRLLRDGGAGEAEVDGNAGDGRGGSLRTDATEKDVGWKVVLFGREESESK